MINQTQYRHQGNVLHFREGWLANDTELILHEGVVGQRGTTDVVAVSGEKDGQQKLAAYLSTGEKDGFETWDYELYAELVLQYQVEGMGTTADLDRRHEIEQVLTEELGWTGNGDCDGGDIGSGTMNVYCFVADPAAGTQTVIDALAGKGWLDGAVIAITTQEDEDEYTVMYPPDYKGSFSTV